ncbi:trehalose-6-phosphate synthase, partial [Candidatus Microgenomates bacterium]|nr:trehalose-6-phosphate synthase [Candidatus Microgenomates bacterium]
MSDMTNADQLVKFVQKQLGDRQFIVAIQREPYLHEFDGKSIKAKKTAGGAHILMDGILRKVGGTMVALGSGSADAEVVDKKGRIKVPPNQDKYTLKRIFLNEKEMDGFYYGFANQTLWPLCHAVFVQPHFSETWWKSYVEVNKKFAQAILEEIKGDKAFVWVNDYHLALLPQMIKEKKPNVTIGTFWHIPWPTHEIFRICPWRKLIL